MIIHPSVIALIGSSVLICGILLASAFYAFQVLRHWSPAEGSERQLLLERKTYLISTILTYTFVFQLISLFLFIHTADSLHSLFVGAMCAAGTLQVNSYGYPVFLLKIVTALLAGLWLIMNHADTRGYDYPLVRKKYFFLLILAPLIIMESWLQALYFMNLKVDVITSCCGTLFSAEREGITSEIAALPAGLMTPLFIVAMALTLLLGLLFLLKGKGGYLFSSLAGASFFISAASLISFISLYIYELPTYHCPFCILQKEYGYVGYPLYITLIFGGITGMGVGLLMPFRKQRSLSAIIPAIQKRLAVASLILYLIFAAITAYAIITSNLRLG
ncbi:MAG: hypothetical protein WC291_04370 [Thermodesulfovibrionales bacterium]|jgi:hypothetical protein